MDEILKSRFLSLYCMVMADGVVEANTSFILMSLFYVYVISITFNCLLHKDKKNI